MITVYQVRFLTKQPLFGFNAGRAWDRETAERLLAVAQELAPAKIVERRA